MTAVTDSIIDRDADICLQNDTFVLQDNASYIVYSPFSELIVRVSSYPYKNSIIDRQLKKQGFFSDLPDTTRQITHWSKFKHLTLLLTRRCNLNCVYCYASGGSGKHQHSDMPINLALDACEWYINHLRDERIRVTFHGGGEPTLEQKTIKKVVGYVNKTGSGKKIRYLITTNGTMNQSFLQWMMDNDFAISISMDGPPEIQDRNRPLANGGASHFLVEESVRYLVKRNYSFTIRLTYDLCDNVEKIVHYFGKLGVKSLHFELLFPFGRLTDQTKYSGEYFSKPYSIDDLLANFLRAMDICKSYGIKINNSHLTHFVRGTGYFCGTSSGESMTVTHDGILTGCLEVVDQNDKDADMFKIGEWVPNKHSFKVNKNKIKVLLGRHVDSLLECSRCFARYICAGGCAVKAFRFSDNFLTKDNSYCSFTRRFIPILIKKIAMLSQI